MLSPTIVFADSPVADSPVAETTAVKASAPFAALQNELVKTWPKNRLVRIVFHGHSVPAGYFRTPLVRTFDAYPSLFHRGLCEQFPNAVIDVDVTAIGGENSISGAARFEQDVLSLRPDLVFIDYCLNDRGVGLERAEAAWRSMITAAQAANVRIVLLTPTPDVREDPLDDSTPLAQHAAQIRRLGREFGLSVVDSYAAFAARLIAGDPLNDFMSQINHPNRRGHEVVAVELAKLFESP